MTSMKIISETPMSVYELKKELEFIKKRDGELSYRSVKAEDYINHVLPSDLAKKADSIYQEITKQNIPRVREIQIKKIIDLNPKTAKEVKAILQSYTITLTNEQIQKILELLNV